MPRDSHRSFILRGLRGRSVRKLVLLGLLMSLLMALAPPAGAAESESTSTSKGEVSTEAPDPQEVLDKIDTAALRAADAQETITPPPALPGAAIPLNPMEAIGPPPDTIPPGWQAGTEIISQRTATTKAFTGRVPGETETRVYPEPVHYKQGDRWLTIDSSLKASDGDSRSAKANDFDLELADSADNPALAKLTLDSAHSVAFGMDKAAKVNGKAGKKSVTYTKVQKSTDVRLTSTYAGVKEELILAGPDAPTRFVFPLTLKGLTASIDEFGDVVYADSNGKEWARTPHGYMFDSNVDPLSDEPAMSNGVTYALIAHGKGTALEVTLDQAWVLDKSRVWPLTVDPEVHRTGWADDTYVMSGFTNDYSSDTELKVGTFNGGANKARSFMHFDTGNLPGTVTHAELEMREMHSYNCAVGPSPVYRATQGWVGSTTRTYPGLTYDPASQATGGWRAGDSCHGRKAWWIVTPTVQHWQNIGETMGSFVARAANEGDSHQWKKYRSFQAGDGPLLKIWTNSGPYTPVELDPGYAQHRLGPSIALSAKHNDPEGDPATLAFGLWSYPARELVWAQWSPWVNSGQRVSVNASMPDAWYYFRVAAYDGQRASDFSWQDHLVFIDTVPPNQPTELTPGPNSTVGTTFTASARYTEPYGWPGELLFWVNNEANTSYVTHAFSPTVGNGQVGSKALNLPVGKYNLYVYGYDLGQLSTTPMGPHSITVANPPSIPGGVTAETGPASAKIKWTPSAPNGSPVIRYNIHAYDATTPASSPAPKSCANPCSPTEGLAFDGLTPGHSYTFKASATNAVGTSNLSSPSAAVTVRGTPDYVDEVEASPGDRQVSLTWEAEFLATSYRIRTYLGPRPSDGVANQAHFVDEKIADAADTTETITGLKNGSHYYFTVTPVVLLLLTGPPTVTSDGAVPFGLPFAPQDVQVLPSDNSAIVMWSPSVQQADGTPGDNGAPITGYRVITFDQGSPDPVKTVDVGAEPTFVAVDQLSNGTAYSFEVQAINQAGAGPAASTTGTQSPGGRPFAPENVSAALSAPRNVSITWAPPGVQANGTAGDNGSQVTGYRVIVSPSCPSCGGTSVGQFTATTVTGLAAGTTYQFRVAARNAFGEGAPSSPPQTIELVAEVPNVPTNVVAEWDQNSPVVRVSWVAPAGNGSPITSYRVTGLPGPIETTTTATSADFANLDPTFAYTFVVRATNGVGEGPPSSPSDPAGSPTQPPTSIQITSVKPKDRSAEIKWEDASGPYRAFNYTVVARQMVGDAIHSVTETDVGPGNTAVVTLPRGEYVFVVRGSNAAGQLESPASDRVTVWNRSEVDQWVFENSMEEFLEVRAANPYPYSFDSDHCSSPWFAYVIPISAAAAVYGEANFVDPCKRHDFGYQNFGKRLKIEQDEPTKQKVMDQFLEDMRAVCDTKPLGERQTCRTVALTWHKVISEAGDSSFYGDYDFVWDPEPDNPES